MYCNNCGSLLNEKGICVNCTNKPKKSKNIVFKLLIVSLLFFVFILLLFLVNKSPKSTLGGSGGSRTIMIYMVGSDLESKGRIASSDLSSINPNKVDMDNINVIVFTGGTTRWYNYVSNEENAIYQLTESGFEKKEVYEKNNTGDYDNLLKLLNYGYDNFKTDLYDLVFWDHGGAIQGSSYDEFTNDNLSLNDYSRALRESNFNGQKLELVLFRTCLNGTIEVANTFKHFANYMIASEEVTIGKAGASVLNFINDIKTSDNAISFSKKFVKSYREQVDKIDPRHTFDSMYSIIDLSKIDKLNETFDAFISGINLKKNYSKIVKIRDNAFQFAYNYGDTKVYDTVDLYNLVMQLEKYSSYSSKKVFDAFDKAIIYHWSLIDDTHGLSVYFPYRGSRTWQNKQLAIYDDLNYSSKYNEFIKEFSNMYLSNRTSSFSAFSFSDKEMDVEDKEATLELDDSQVNDYASAVYYIFEDKGDGYYRPIYSSDNVSIEENKIKTNISNNLIKAYDKNSEDYVMLLERDNLDKKILSTSAIFNDFSSENIDDWKTIFGRIMFDMDEDTPVISSIISGDEDEEDEVTSSLGSIISLKEYKTAEFSTTKYKILNDNGEYDSNWDNNGVVNLIQFETDSLKFKKASLDDKDYYCLFKVYDIYGNYYYSKLMKF